MIANRRAPRPWLQGCLLATAVAVSLLLVLFASAQQSKPTAKAKPADGKLAEDVYKNIKSLRGQPANQLIPTMEFMASSLGVECEFCHDMKAFDKDTKDEKRTAREMIEMQEGINKRSFKGEREVTCNTCHHGAQHPAATPAIPELTAAIPEPVREHGAHRMQQPTSPTAYLDDFFKAAGGEAALSKITSRTERGSMSFGSGPAVKFEIYSRSSGEYSSVVELTQGKTYSTFNGHTGWLVYPGRHSREMSSGEQEAARVEADVEFPFNFKQRYTKFRADHPGSIEGKPANVLIASRPGQPPVRLYFDAGSHLLVRVIYYIETPLGRNPVQIDITNYTAADGVQIPSRWIVSEPFSRATYTLEASDIAPIDESRFAPPPAAESPAH